MKKYPAFLAVLLIQCSLLWAQPVSFSEYFINKTMRLDYYHTADADKEIMTIDCIYQQGEWGGNPDQLLDPFNNGLYRIQIYDIASNTLIYSRGFNSYCGEYQTTRPAIENIKKTFHESARFPCPQKPVLFVLQKRDNQNLFHPVFSRKINPDDVHIVKEAAASFDRIVVVRESGAPHDKVDIALLAEGYTNQEWKKFQKDCKRFSKTLFSVEPYKRQPEKFNIRGVFRPSFESGVDQPRKNIYKQTALNASFNALNLERYLLTEDNRTLHNIAAQVPYDALVIMVNSKRYGGGGIYNFYSISTTDHEMSMNVFLHEFGHSFAGLADEYYASAVAYNDFYPKATEPVEPNITALLDPDHIKWRDMISTGVSIPSDWNKTVYDSLQAKQGRLSAAKNRALAALDNPSEQQKNRIKAKYKTKRKAVKDALDAFMKNHPLKNKVGAFEGAGYSSTGLYRPMLQCLMFSNNDMQFCRVCENAIQRMIDYYTR